MCICGRAGRPGHLNNLRFRKLQNINHVSAAPVVVYFVSNKMMTCRLLK